MTERQRKKRAFLTSIITLILSVAMLVGTTFSWFTDTTSNKGNRIEAGILKVELLKHDGTDYVDISGGTGSIFNSNIWEPGKTEVAILQVKNSGSLAFNYNIVLNVKNANADAANTAKLEEVVDYAILSDVDAEAYNKADFSNWEKILQGKNMETGDVPVGETKAALNGALEAEESDYFVLAIHMDELAGNSYQGAALTIDLDIVAKQMMSETDSFGSNQYDKDAIWPEVEKPQEPAPEPEPEPEVQWVDVLNGVGNFETDPETNWPALQTGNDTEIKFLTGGAPEGSTYLFLGDGDAMWTSSRVCIQGDNSTKIELGEYKVTGWVRQDGEDTPKIQVWDGAGWVTFVCECAETGEWEQFEFTFTLAGDNTLCFRLNNTSNEKLGDVAFDDIKLLRKVTTDIANE